MRVLIVDSDPGYQAELTALLTESGHAPAAVPSAAEAVAVLERAEFDVMFTDLHLRRRSGMNLLQEVRQRWPRVLIVMLATNATVETAVEALHLGALDYLRKPVRPEQVRRVLEVVAQQLALVQSKSKPLDPARFARSLADEGGYEVLLITPPPPPRPATAQVNHLPLDPDDPAGMQGAVHDFTAPRDKVAVVLAAVELLFERHREEEVAALLEAMRRAVEGKGPLAVGYDPDRISATGALAVRAAVASADVHMTLESLSSPIRRVILRRLADGPCSFNRAMEVARIDDTSKIAFHLRRLTESGLVAHTPRGNYWLTERGKGALKVLGAMDDLDSGKGSGNRVFVAKRPKRTATASPGPRKPRATDAEKEPLSPGGGTGKVRGFR